LNPDSPIEETIWLHGRYLIDDLLAKADQPATIQYPIHLAVAGVIYTLVFGPHQNIREDLEFQKFLRTNEIFTDMQKAGGNPADLMPWLSMFFQNRVKQFMSITTGFRSIIQRQEQEHRATFKPNRARDIMDALIQVSRDTPEEELRAAGMTHEHIMSTPSDLIGAGQNTVTSTLNWISLYMVLFPHIQDRVQQEIDDVLGDDQPTPLDRKRMPYTEACLLESWRYSAQVPFLLPHSSTCDTTLFDYDIPKDTLVFVNMWSVGRDPDVWRDPDTFDPTRFLDEDGMLNKTKAEDIFAFGAGKRRCLGELLARVESFILFAMMMQNVRLEKAPGVEYSLKGKFGLSLDCQDYEYIVRKRVK